MRDEYVGLPYASGSETSMEAAKKSAGSKKTMRDRVAIFEFICGSNGVSDDDIDVALGLGLNTIHARRRELQLHGLIFPRGKGFTRKNKRAVLWRPTGKPFPDPWTTPPRAKAQRPESKAFRAAVAEIREMYLRDRAATGNTLSDNTIKVLQWMEGPKKER